MGQITQNLWQKKQKQREMRQWAKETLRRPSNTTLRPLPSIPTTTSSTAIAPPPTPPSENTRRHSKMVKKTIEVKPDWGKGYSRKGLALYKLDQLEEAMQCYQDGLKVEPDNDALKQSLREAQNAASAQGTNMLAQLFRNPSLWTIIQSDPNLSPYLAQPDFVQMINNVQQNPQTLNTYLQSDKRLMAVMTKLLTAQMGGFANQPDDQPEPAGSQSAPETTPKQEQRDPEPEPEPEPELDPKEKEALEEKDKGNAAYKKRDFDAAIAHYDKAIELNPKEMSFLTNRAAVHLETGRF